MERNHYWNRPARLVNERARREVRMIKIIQWFLLYNDRLWLLLPLLLSSPEEMYSSGDRERKRERVHARASSFFRKKSCEEQKRCSRKVEVQERGKGGAWERERERDREERKNEGTYANENPSSFWSVAAEVLAGSSILRLSLRICFCSSIARCSNTYSAEGGGWRVGGGVGEKEGGTTNENLRKERMRARLYIRKIIHLFRRAIFRERERGGKGGKKERKR